MLLCLRVSLTAGMSTNIVGFKFYCGSCVYHLANRFISEVLFSNFFKEHDFYKSLKLFLIKLFVASKLIKGSTK